MRFINAISYLTAQRAEQQPGMSQKMPACGANISALHAGIDQNQIVQNKNSVYIKPRGAAVRRTRPPFTARLMNPAPARALQVEVA